MENLLPIDVAAIRDRNLVAWIRLACLLLLAALAIPFFAGQVYVADDLGEYHLPLRAFYSDQLARGEAFDWLPTLFSGFYLTGEGQVGTYHPLHWLLYRCLPLGAAFDLELLASYPFMAIGMAVFLRRRLKNRAAAWFGALVFTFSGFNLLHFVHPNAVAVVAHIPWILWAVDVALGPSQTRQASLARLAVGLLTASQLLLGYPQYVWFSLLAEAGYIAWRLRSHDGTQSLARLLTVQCFGILAGAIQWLPTFDAWSVSVRQSADATFVNSGSLHPLNLVQLVAPYLFQTRVVGQNTHELGLYVGAVPCLLCGWLIVNRRRLGGAKPLAIATLALGVVSLVLAFGQYGWLYSLQQYLPVVGGFRFPCRAIVLFQFAMAIAAALGFLLLQTAAQPLPLPRGEGRGEGAWDSSTSSTLSKRLSPIWWIAALSVAVAIAGPWLWSPYVAPLAYGWIGPALFVFAAILITRAANGSRRALIAIVLLAAVDQGVYGASYAIFAPSRTADLHQFVAATPAPAVEPGAPRGERISLEGACREQGPRPGNRILLTGAARIDGYVGLEPAKQLDYRQAENLRLAGAQWQQTCADQASHEAAPQWAAVEQPVPRARWVAPITSADLGTAEIQMDRPGQIAVLTQSPTSQTLALAESYHSGWQATVDGRPVPVVRVDGDFLGCVVAAGRHRVDWQFHPRSLRYGALLSAGGLGLLLCSLAWDWRKSSRRA